MCKDNNNDHFDADDKFLRVHIYRKQRKEIPIFVTDKNINSESISEIIEEAVFPDGKIGVHQRRIGFKKLNVFKNELLMIEEEIMSCTEFDQIYEKVFDVAGGIKGIGELTVYDTSLRLGKMMGDLYPEKVYLHAGTRVGAINLGIISKKNTEYIDNIYQENENVYIERIYKSLRKLVPYEIEDYLCRRKDFFASRLFKKYFRI